MKQNTFRLFTSNTLDPYYADRQNNHHKTYTLQMQKMETISIRKDHVNKLIHTFNYVENGNRTK